MLILLLLFSHPFDDIPVTHFVSSKPIDLIGYSEYLSREPRLRVKIGLVEKGGVRGPQINLIVNTDIYWKLYSYLNPSTGIFVSDLISEGFSVEVDTMHNSSNPYAPESLRTFLKQEYGSDSCVGALLIGDLPIAWFQMMEVFWGWVPNYTEFPIDLFYMDMDGIWEDTLKNQGSTLIPGSDSIYDTHRGDLKTEIFIGRLTVPPNFNDSLLLSNYFHRNHLYRIDSLQLLNRALFFIDDDWVPWKDYWKGDLSAVYDSIVEVSDPETTIADVYRDRIKRNYEWISLFAHSSPTHHGFTYNSGSLWSWFYTSEIPDTNPKANFYNLYACSNSRYTENDYGAGMYVFNDSFGIGSIGSAKTGGMVEYNVFYDAIADGKCLGDAFRVWFDSIAASYNDTTRSWFYGMNLIGDATFLIKPASGIIVLEDEIGSDGYEFGVTHNSGKFYIQFTMPEWTKFEVSIYDITGRTVNTLYRGYKEAGTYQLVWRGIGDRNTVLPSGIYFCQFSSPKFSKTKKILLIK